MTTMAPVASATEVMAAKAAMTAEVMTAAVVPTEVVSAAMVPTEVVSVMTASVMAAVSRFGDDRHCHGRHQRHHEYDYALHYGSLGVF